MVQTGSTLQVPYTIKNGKFKDEEFFHLLRFLDDEITAISIKYKNKLWKRYKQNENNKSKSIKIYGYFKRSISWLKDIWTINNR